MTSSVLFASLVVTPFVALANENNGDNRGLPPGVPHIERQDGNKDMRWGTSTASTTKMRFEKDLKNASSTATSTWKEHGTSTDRENVKKNEKKGHGDKFKMDAAKTADTIAKIAAKLGVLGTEIKDLANAQASSSVTVADTVNKIEGRNPFKTFFIGADYKNLGALMSQVAQSQARLNQLENQVSKMASSTDKATLTDSINTLKQDIASLETFIKDNINKFSLFGWFVQKFNK